jgi:hypothetical protein
MRSISLRDKKAQEMSVGTIIIIILALLVLVFLVFGFSQGWGNLWDKITNWGGGQSNVQTIIQACNIACDTGGGNTGYDYNFARTVNFGKVYVNGAQTSVTANNVTCGNLKQGFCVNMTTKYIYANNCDAKDYTAAGFTISC